jgi:protein-S-isoprenylcysteine O-methyltransferase Ste14
MKAFKVQKVRNKKEHFRYILFLLVQAVTGLMSLIITYYKHFHSSSWNCMQYIGCIIAVIGFLGWITARIQLGQLCTIMPQATQLVKHGLYTRISNPVYLFGILLLCGFIFITNRLELLAILIVIIPIQYYRATQESRLLEAQFGNSYRKYRKQLWI